MKRFLAIAVVSQILNLSTSQLLFAQKCVNPHFDAHRLDFRDLGYPGATEIAADASPITALLAHSNGKVYGATSGGRHGPDRRIRPPRQALPFRPRRGNYAGSPQSDESAMIVLVLASILSLTNRFGSVSVDTTGARVLSYVPDGGREVFARLPSGYGGVPLCWPWFQYNGPRGDRSPKHGLVREREFATVECANGADRSLAVLRLESDDATRRIWPHDFVLTVRIELSERGLALDMTGENTGERPFEVTEAFHPYLLRTERERIPDDGTGEFRTWDPDASSHLKTQDR